jgi:HPt (histidine-containing phosphotransfer) domain-containing protein
MADIVYIDREDGEKRVMNNAKLYAKLLGKFKTETNFDSVFAALDAENYEEAQNLVHTIKGITANLSIKDLNEKIVMLEAQIKTKTVDPQTITAVKTSYAATIPEVEKVILENG